MLCAIEKRINSKIVAVDVEKADGPFLCPKCHEEVILRKGKIRLHHFAHRSPITCQFGLGESAEHRNVKWIIYRELKDLSDVSECVLEKDFGTVVSDVYAVIRGTPIAIEIQISSLSLEEINYRTQEYFKKKIAVLWLPIFSRKLFEDKYAPSAWEKWLHAAYFGRVYYWLNKLEIVPVHFDPYLLYVNESTWYDIDGEETGAGGFYRNSKRWRKPICSNSVNIMHDFAIRNRKSWTHEHISIPDSRLLIDKRKPFWSKK